MTRFQYLVLYQHEQGLVPASVFFALDGSGTVRGLYFGSAGSGTFDEAYFRMEGSALPVTHFLECDDAHDTTFVRDRGRKAWSRKAVLLSPADAQVFTELRAYRMSWWSFAEDDRVRMRSSRMKSFRRADLSNNTKADEVPLLCAFSRTLDQGVLERIHEHWSLRP